MQPDSGTVSTGSLQIGYLKQETQEANTAQSVLEKAMSAFAAVKELEAEEDVLLKELEVHPDHEDPDHERLLIRLDEIHGRLAALEAHRAQPKAEAILTGLGFHPDDQGRPISSFSGGWRMRVALAHLLLSSPDILLLDEPTNHLDIDSIDWLERRLRPLCAIRHPAIPDRNTAGCRDDLLVRSDCTGSVQRTCRHHTDPY